MDDRQTQNGASAGPLGAAAIDAWIEAAQPGARLIYFSGYLAGAGDRYEPLAEKMAAEAARGMIHVFHQRRTGAAARQIQGFDYLAIRSSRPSPKAAASGVPGRRAQVVRSMAEQAAAESSRFTGRSVR